MTKPLPPDETLGFPGENHDGAAIGRYKLLQRLGEGGFGTVWMAQQDEPVRRTVAVKILKAGMDTRQVIARFDAERQALALMDHPNIAKVLDGGATEHGRPYFVMELVRGVPITKYCDDAKLTTRERLELFRQVCGAVQHAHQKGIIHRDLKPSNILVASQDGVPAPKVIDFGIAKAVAAPLTERTLFTELGQMLGTPEYMAPEQADASGLDVDTRADIYSLGVVLYELLTGTKPFDLQALLERGHSEILRTIREVDPPKPSTRISTLGAKATPLARQRRVAPGQFGRALRGDLDWIVMKAIEKERSRRYETVASLSYDVARFLSDRPVLAGPPSTVYRLRKYAKRHRLGVAAAAAITLSLAAGLFAAAAGYLEAGASEKRAKTEASRSGMVVTLLGSMLGGADPYGGKGEGYTLRQLLDDFDAELGDRLSGEPEVDATVRSILGRAYRGLGLSDKAEKHVVAALDIRRRVLGETAEPTLEAWSDWAELLYDKGDYAGAEREASAGLAAARRVSMVSPLVARFLYVRGMQLERLGRAEEAEATLREALAMLERVLGPDHEETGLALFALAFVLRDGTREDQWKEAEGLLRRYLDIVKKARGPEHANIAMTLDNLGVLALKRGAWEEAESDLRQSLDLARRQIGEDHPDYATTLCNLARVRGERGDRAEAEALLRQAVAIYRKSLGDDHPDLATAITRLAGVVRSKGDSAEAERLLREAVAIFRKHPEQGRSSLVAALSSLAETLGSRRDFAAQERVTREILAEKRALVAAPPTNPGLRP
jgi:tetratricopeptide (TPR) repeat protein